MPSVPGGKRLPAVLLVLLAVGIVAWSGWFVYTDFRPAYSLSATPVDAAPDDVDVLAAEDLPPDARQAFERARDGEYVVHEKPGYLDTVPLYESVYVSADGTVYELWARTDGVDGLSLILAVPALVLALGLGVVGAWSYRRENVRTPLTLVTALGAGTVAAVAWPFSATLFLAGVPVGPEVVGALAAVAAAAITWVRVGRTDFA